MQRIIHNLTSTSRRGFGIHSPFVYDFQKEILRSIGNGKNRKDKHLKLLFAIKDKFDLQHTLVLDKDYSEQTKGDLEVHSTQSYDLILLNSLKRLKDIKLAPFCFVLLTGGHQSIISHELSEECDVFLDLYSVGICIFRKGLSKQKFKLAF